MNITTLKYCLLVGYICASSFAAGIMLGQIEASIIMDGSTIALVILVAIAFTAALAAGLYIGNLNR